MAKKREEVEGVPVPEVTTTENVPAQEDTLTAQLDVPEEAEPEALAELPEAEPESVIALREKLTQLGIRHAEQMLEYSHSSATENDLKMLRSLCELYQTVSQRCC